MIRNTNTVRLLVASLTLALAATHASAAAKNWTGKTGSGWGGIFNWAPTGVPAAGDTVTFSNAFTLSVSLGTNRTIKSITFDHTGSYTLDGSTETLTVGDITVVGVSGAVTHTINSAVAPASGAVWTINGNELLAVTGNLSGSNNLSKQGNGTLVLSGGNGSYTGDIDVTAGELEAGVFDSLGSISNVDIGANGTLRIVANEAFGGITGQGSVIFEAIGNIGNNNAANALYSGAISGSGPLFKSGTGLLELSGLNTYFGGTEVRSGTLLLSNTTGSATGSSTVEVQSGAILGGSGRSSAATTVLTGGTIAPGDAIGTLTLGNVTLGTGSTLEIELGGLDLPPSMIPLTMLVSSHPQYQPAGVA